MTGLLPLWVIPTLAVVCAVILFYGFAHIHWRWFITSRQLNLNPWLYRHLSGEVLWRAVVIGISFAVWGAAAQLSFNWWLLFMPAVEVAGAALAYITSGKLELQPWKRFPQLGVWGSYLYAAYRLASWGAREAATLPEIGNSAGRLDGNAFWLMLLLLLVIGIGAGLAVGSYMAIVAPRFRDELDNASKQAAETARQEQLRAATVGTAVNSLQRQCQLDQARTNKLRARLGDLALALTSADLVDAPTAATSLLAMFDAQSRDWLETTLLGEQEAEQQQTELEQRLRRNQTNAVASVVNWLLRFQYTAESQLRARRLVTEVAESMGSGAWSDELTARNALKQRCEEACLHPSQFMADVELLRDELVETRRYVAAKNREEMLQRLLRLNREIFTQDRSEELSGDQHTDELRRAYHRRFNGPVGKQQLARRLEVVNE